MKVECMNTWQDIGAVEDFSEEQAVPMRVGGVSLAVFRLENEIYALYDLCTHGNAKLSDGYIENGCVECPLHQGLFDIKSGAPRCAPVTEAVRAFPIRQVAGRVEVALGEVRPEPAVVTAQMVAQVSAKELAAPDVSIIKMQTEQALPYQAGQYLNILLADGQQRSYSMASAAGSQQLELHIRHMPGGVFTDHVFAALSVNDMLKLDGPHGNFYLRPGQAPIILVASGTGFAPIKAMVESAVAAGNTRTMQLYWGGRQRQDIYMWDLCQSWSEQWPWFSFVPVLSAATVSDNWHGRTGWVHQAVMQDHADLSQHEVYVCGAPFMVDAARNDFTTLCRLRAESFFADAFLSKADNLIIKQSA